MIELITQKRIRFWMAVGLVLNICCSIFSVGYHHPDEHFQVLEFCNYKMGGTPATQLPMEFAMQCRAAMLPFIAYCFGKLFYALHIYNHFILVMVLRLAMGLANWLISYKMYFILQKEISTQSAKLVFAISLFALWFVPYTSVRFSSENVSAVLLSAALYLLLTIRQNSKRAFLKTLLSGIMLGFSFYCRPQIGFAIAGIAIWVLMVEKWDYKYILYIAIGGLCSISISMCIDKWFYGTWVFTPYNYYNLNIVQNRAAYYGVYPWWYYFTSFIKMGIPPISIVLLLLFIMGILKKPYHLLSLIAITFIAGHTVIGHKELRFLYPIIIPFLFIAACGFENIGMYIQNQKTIRIGLYTLFIINIPLLLYRTVSPAQEAVKYLEHIYNYANHHNTALIYINKSPYQFMGTEACFYKPNRLASFVVDDSDQFINCLKNNPDKDILFLSEKHINGKMLWGKKIIFEYSLFPEWLLRNTNYNDWQSRSRIWTIYKVMR